MKLIDVAKKFSTEDQCLDYLETMRWPHGVGCVHCGSVSVSTIRRNDGKNKRVRIYQCLENEWGTQFTATSGTIFNDSHLPLTKWFIATLLLCEAKYEQSGLIAIVRPLLHSGVWFSLGVAGELGRIAWRVQRPCAAAERQSAGRRLTGQMNGNPPVRV